MDLSWILTWSDVFWALGLVCVYWAGFRRGKQHEKEERAFIDRVVADAMRKIAEMEREGS